MVELDGSRAILDEMCVIGKVKHVYTCPVIKQLGTELFGFCPSTGMGHKHFSRQRGDDTVSLLSQSCSGSSKPLLKWGYDQ
jgi:hypothetical protein